MINNIYYRNAAKNFESQLSELKRVINDFKSKNNSKPLSIYDFDSRLFSNFIL